ncbi:hypothetical protein SERLA73DRAFT_175309, partial [Serpula lacrymans var. lacrymans S7.3]
MDEDLAIKRTKRGSHDHDEAPILVQSRYFSGGSGTQGSARSRDNVLSDMTASTAGSSRIYDLTLDKESLFLDTERRDDSMWNVEEVLDPVTQEEGYISPTPSYCRLDTPDISSPVRPRSQAKRHFEDDFDDFGADIVSSPVAVRSLARQCCRLDGPKHNEVLVPDTPTPSHRKSKQKALNGPNLRHILAIDLPSDIEPPSSGPVTPEHTGQTGRDRTNDVIDVDSTVENSEPKVCATRNEI